MGRLTDAYQERARREMVQLFNSAISEVESFGYVGNFYDVVLPALTEVLVEQVKISGFGAELDRDGHSIDELIRRLEQVFASGPGPFPDNQVPIAFE